MAKVRLILLGMLASAAGGNYIHSARAENFNCLDYFPPGTVTSALSGSWEAPQGGTNYKWGMDPCGPGALIPASCDAPPFEGPAWVSQQAEQNKNPCQFMLICKSTPVGAEKVGDGARFTWNCTSIPGDVPLRKITITYKCGEKSGIDGEVVAVKFGGSGPSAGYTFQASVTVVCGAPTPLPPVPAPAPPHAPVLPPVAPSFDCLKYFPAGTDGSLISGSARQYEKSRVFDWVVNSCTPRSTPACTIPPFSGPGYVIQKNNETDPCEYNLYCGGKPKAISIGDAGARYYFDEHSCVTLHGHYYPLRTASITYICSTKVNSFTMPAPVIASTFGEKENGGYAFNLTVTVPCGPP